MELPSYLVYVDYSGGFEPKLQATTFIDGRSKLTSLQSIVPISLSLTYRVESATILHEFQNFVRVNLKNGTRLFKWRCPTNGEYYLARIVGRVNFKIENTKNMRGFMGPYLIDFEIEYWVNNG